MPPLDTSDFTRSRGFDALYGLEILELTAELVVGRFEVRPALLQPFGLLHGGVYAAAAESLASHGAGFAALQEGKVAMGMSNLTSFLRPATEGTISVRATRRYHGTHVGCLGCRQYRCRGQVMRDLAGDDRDS